MLASQSLRVIHATPSCFTRSFPTVVTILKAAAYVMYKVNIFLFGTKSAERLGNRVTYISKQVTVRNLTATTRQMYKAVSTFTWRVTVEWVVRCTTHVQLNPGETAAVGRATRDKFEIDIMSV
jgi:hypothetical protein